MASRSRSPNYPSLSLGEAIEAVRPVYAKERRAKFPRLALAAHLGYSSMNGRALAKIGALRAYGLIDGREDALTVSQTALALLEAPAGSRDRTVAYQNAFLAPPLFRRIKEEHGDQTPSPETLRWWLQQEGYAGDAADRALRVFLESADLVSRETESRGSTDGDLEADDAEADEFVQSDPALRGAFAEVGRRAREAEHRVRRDTEDLRTGAHERVLQSGMLSKTASYKLIVTGEVGLAEIERLIRKIELDKEILADPGNDSSDLA